MAEEEKPASTQAGLAVEQSPRADDPLTAAVHRYGESLWLTFMADQISRFSL